MQAPTPHQSLQLFLASTFPPWCYPEGILLGMPDPQHEWGKAGLSTVAMGGEIPPLSGLWKTLSQEQAGALGI